MAESGQAKGAMPSVGSVMTAQPLTIDALQCMTEAQELMLKKKIRHLPVMKDGKPISILSERDLSLVLAHYKDHLFDGSLTVENFTTKEAVLVQQDQSLAEVLLIMAEQVLGSVVVMNGDELVGIFTTTDNTAGSQNRTQAFWK